MLLSDSFDINHNQTYGSPQNPCTYLFLNYKCWHFWSLFLTMGVEMTNSNWLNLIFRPVHDP